MIRFQIAIPPQLTFGQDKMARSLHNFAYRVPLDTHDHTGGERVASDSGVHGAIHLDRAWHAVGHSVRPNLLANHCPFPLITSQNGTSKTSRQYKHNLEACATLIDQLDVFNHQMNVLLEEIDKAQFDSLTAIWNTLKETRPWLEGMSAYDCQVIGGRAIIFNRRSGEHRDGGDDPLAWAFLIVLGDFVNGEMVLKDVNLRTRYLPGDVIIMRGNVLWHEVESYIGTERICMVLFSHGAIAKELGIPIRTDSYVPI